jgi:hypothetical protein
MTLVSARENKLAEYAACYLKPAGRSEPVSEIERAACAER